ncbi:hypothetical protein LRR81_09660 [Metabacillus sp. GX 13764]|uniref:hypothetical protein n=1 Tax=Metabacillus kandeliae TaxID=2900151 RepID=UPI001E34BB49|nr:hypothetical protein [Metabacillus kandeliae]MCD7034504.1 hypothetical protein [Metabacillus kandeliae]
MKKPLLAGISSVLILSSGLFAPSAHAATATASSYQEAVRQGNLLAGKTSSYATVISKGNISSISSSYDSFNAQLKKTEAAAGKVSGQTNRQKLLAKYVTPAKIQLERTIYEVSVYRLLANMNNKIDDANYEIDADMSKLQRLKKRAAQIKEAGGYKALPAQVSNTLLYNEAHTEGEYLQTITDGYTYLADEDGDIYTMDYIFDYFTHHLAVAEQKIGQTPGASNRTALAKKYTTPAKVAYERTKYEISRLRLIYTISDLADQKKIDEAKKEAAKLQRLKDRAAAIKKAGGYKPLSPQVEEYLAEDEQLALELLK